MRRGVSSHARFFSAAPATKSYAPSFLRNTNAQTNNLKPPTFRIGAPLSPPRVPVQIRDRKYLPANRNDAFPQVLAPPRPFFPPVLEAEEGGGGSMAVWARAVKPQVDALLSEYGCAYVKGLPMRNAQEFSAFMKTVKLESQCDTFMAGRSMTSSNVADQVRTGSDDDARYTIEPHHEYNVASAHRPRKLYLICSEEPTHGGEWLLTCARKVMQDLDKNVVEKFEKLGVKYEIFYPSKATPDYYNCWEDNIAPTRAEAEKYLSTTGCQWTWYDHDNSLLIYRFMPATSPHPITKEKVWFNQIHAHHKTFYQGCHPDFEGQWENNSMAWPVHTKYGDGTEIEDETLAHIRDVVWRHTVGLPLTLGDMLVVDNYRVMHGRMGFQLGTPRQTLVSITYQ